MVGPDVAALAERQADAATVALPARAFPAAAVRSTPASGYRFHWVGTVARKSSHRPRLMPAVDTVRAVSGMRAEP